MYSINQGFELAKQLGAKKAGTEYMEAPPTRREVIDTINDATTYTDISGPKTLESVVNNAYKLERRLLQIERTLRKLTEGVTFGADYVIDNITGGSK